VQDGHAEFSVDPGRHVLVEAGQPPCLRLVERDPIDGARPSADLLFGTLARSGAPAAAAVLTGMGQDGAKGLKLLSGAGAHTIVQDPATAMVSEAPAAAIAAGAGKAVHPLDDIGPALLKACSQA